MPRAPCPERRRLRSDDEAEVGAISGFNKIQAAMAHFLPVSLLTGQHRRMVAPGTASN